MHENITRIPSFLQLNSVRQGLIANAMAHKAPNMASRVTTNVQCAFIITMNDPQSCSLTGSNTKWDVVIDWTLNPLQGLRRDCFLATLFSSNHNHPTEKMLHICKLMDEMCFLEHWGGLKRGQFCEHLNKFMNSVRALPMRFSERVNRFKWRWFEILSPHVSLFPCSSCAEDCKAS